jgi:cytochrome P450
MSVPEILCQISTFLAAGHETTSSALTWCLYALSRSPLSQKRLRDAIRSVCPSSPTIDEDIARLPYLDWVIRESLRVHAPVTSTMRVAGRDDEIPVRKPFLDRHGQTRRCIKVKKHDIITIPIQAINKSKDVWGEDAHVFRYVKRKLFWSLVAYPVWQKT